MVSQRSRTSSARARIPGLAGRAGLTGAVARLPRLGSRLALRLHRYGIGPRPIEWQQLVNLVERHRPTVVSVDVFDTCLIRDLVGDEPIELAIEHRTGGAAGPATRAAELEQLLCHPVPGVADALNRIRDAGSRIVFLSDTDRSSATLTTILTRAGMFHPGDDLIASCEAGATKSSGRLFTQTFSRPSQPSQPSTPPDCDVSGGEIWHVGNNLWSDVVMAEHAGLRAFNVVVAEPTRYEAAMAHRPSTAGPAVAAAARSARLAIIHDADKPNSRTTRLEVLGAQVAGQAFGAFALWVAQQAREEDLRHLSFLSRDGELLLDMARTLPRDHWDDRTLGYLHCSRWSWLLSGAVSYGLDEWLETGTRDHQAFIHSSRHTVGFGSLLGRIGLTPADLEDRPAHSTLAGLLPGRPLPETMVDEWNALLVDDDIGRLILERAAVRKALIVDYLRGLPLPEGRIGLVDVGWRGRLAWAMSPLVAEVTGAEPVHLHFGGSNVLADADARIEVRRFAFDGLTDPSPITNPVSCVETITASGRARVVGYDRRDDGSALPMFDREVAEVRNTDRRSLWAGAVKTACRLPTRSRLDELGCNSDSLGAEANQVLALWWTRPRREEVVAMRGLAFETDDDGQAIEPLVSPYSPTEVVSDNKRPRQWRQGSAAVTAQPFGAAIAAVRRVRSRLGR